MVLAINTATETAYYIVLGIGIAYWLLLAPVWTCYWRLLLDYCWPLLIVLACAVL